MCQRYEAMIRSPKAAQNDLRYDVYDDTVVISQSGASSYASAQVKSLKKGGVLAS